MSLSDYVRDQVREMNLVVHQHCMDNLLPSRFGSKASMWGDALRDGVVSRHEYDQARDYYVNLWSYAGD